MTPCAPLGFHFRNAAVLMALLGVPGLTVLLASVAGLVAARHRGRTIRLE
ncbi:hypothetical protein SAMN05444164_3799 [Bradyrhizobium erythrophlei]|uniref:Uncharacterized protein n=1 Tax=Bradyrhizobium erythrophlei TaxID=1437360 RepID=A0A1H4Y6H2_9BRAD|nr:hypothetical protein SAMN05444164_3799 [Bradyrhizobium erythrophlei]